LISGWRFLLDTLGALRALLFWFLRFSVCGFAVNLGWFFGFFFWGHWRWHPRFVSGAPGLPLCGAALSLPPQRK
jgi:hypothetical protein